MKRIYIITILAAICGLTAMAQNRPDIAHQNTGRDRIEFGFYADQPTLVYDDVTNEIAVYGNESEFYDVIIMSASSQQVVLVTVIDGTYDIIDASIMSSGAYTIELTSSHGNIYRWTFNQGLEGLTAPGITLDKIGDLMNRRNGFDTLQQ